MAEEIKEILEEISNDENYSNFIDGQYGGAKYYLLLEKIEGKQLLNYITNLQKENENLLYEINGYLEEKERLKEKINKLEDYKQRNKKAVEWCKCVINSKTTIGILPNGKRTDMGYCLDLAKPLLNILEGGDE